MPTLEGGTFAASVPRSITVVLAAAELAKRKGISRCFSERAGFVLVRCPNSAAEILACCQKFAPCVLILTEVLTLADELADFLRFAKALRGVRILALGPHDSPGTARDVLRAGCMGFLESGCSNYMLRRAVRSVASGELWASRRVMSQVIQELLLAQSEDKLTPREHEILDLVGQGCRNREIAKRLFISAETVRWHLRGLYAKIGVKDRLTAAAFAVEHPGPSPRMPAGSQRTVRRLVAAS